MFPLVADQIQSNVSVLYVFPSESPVATVTPAGPVRVRVGEPINLECQASGEPRPSVSWHRLDSNRKTMLSSPVPMESNAVMQVLIHLITPSASGEQFKLSITGPVSRNVFLFKDFESEADV